MNYKAQTSPDKYIDSTVRDADVIAASRWRRSPTAPLIEHYQGWVAICANKVASAVACMPIRMYATEAAVKRYGLRAKSASAQRVKWLRDGSGDTRPSVKASIYAEQTDGIMQVEDHDALRLLWKPNPFQTGYDVAWITEAMLCITGDGYQHKVVGDEGRPVELWPMFSQWVVIQPDREEFIRGYFYGADNVTAEFYPRDEVIHHRQPSVFSPFYGQGELISALGAVRRIEALDAMQQAMLENQARFDFVGINKNGLNADQVEQFQERLRAGYGGPHNAGKALLLGGEWEINPAQWAPKDLNLNADEKDQRDRICAHFGVPVSMVTVEDVNRANGEVGSPQFLKYTVLPKLNRRADTLTDGLLLDFGFEEGEVWFAYDNPVPEDRQFIQSSVVANVAQGIQTRNEARAALGLQAVEDESADVLTINGMPLSRAADPFGLGSMGGAGDETPAADAGAGVVSPSPVDDKTIRLLLELATVAASGTVPVESARAMAVAGFPNVPVETINAIFGPIVPRALPEPEPSDSGLEADPKPNIGFEADSDDDEADAGEKSAAPTTVKHSEIWQTGCTCKTCGDGHNPTKGGKAVGDDREPSAGFVRAVRQYYAAKSAAVVEAAEREKMVTKDIIDRLGLADPQWSEMLRRLTEPHRSRAVTKGSRKAIEQFGQALAASQVQSAIGVTNPAVRERYEADTRRFLKSVMEEDERVIRQVILNAAEQGRTGPQAAADLRNAFSDMAAFRSETIARTENARAMTLGQVETYKASGIVSRKKWLLAPAACEFCRAMAAQFGEQTVGEPFAKRGGSVVAESGRVYELDYEDVDGPPLHPNDRCDMIAVIDRGNP